MFEKEIKITIVFNFAIIGLLPTPAGFTNGLIPVAWSANFLNFSMISNLTKILIYLFYSLLEITKKPKIPLFLEKYPIMIYFFF